MFIRQIIGIVGNPKKSCSLLHLFGLAVISPLLHLDGLRPRVYYTLTNFRGRGGGKAPLAPLQYVNDHWLFYWKSLTIEIVEVVEV